MTVHRSLLSLAILSATPLAACGTTENANLKLLLSDLQTCHRSYTLAVGSGGIGLAGPSANGTLNITCDPVIPTTPQSISTAINGQVLASPPPAH